MAMNPIRLLQALTVFDLMPDGAGALPPKNGSWGMTYQFAYGSPNNIPPNLAYLHGPLTLDSGYHTGLPDWVATSPTYLAALAAGLVVEYNP